MRTHVRDLARGADVEDRGVLAQVRDLAAALLAMLRNTAQLAGGEARLVARRFAVRSGLFVAWTVLAAIGAAVLVAGLAWGVAVAVGMPAWAALAVIGALVLAAGGIGAKRALSSLSQPDLGFQRTLTELEADVAALQGACEDCEP